jgi:hypothetical protein
VALVNEKLSVIGSRHSARGFFHPFSVSEHSDPFDLATMIGPDYLTTIGPGSAAVLHLG